MRKTNFKKKDFEVFWDFIIRYYELDPQGIVHNSNHAAFYDQATLAYFKYIDYDYESEVELTGKDFHTVKISIEYLKPLYLDDEVEIGVKIEKIGTSSLTFVRGMFLKETEEDVGSCELIWVYTDIKKKQSTPIPEDQINKLKVN